MGERLRSSCGLVYIRLRLDSTTAKIGSKKRRDAEAMLQL
jgi:hypothetical protein